MIQGIFSGDKSFVKLKGYITKRDINKFISQNPQNGGNGKYYLIRDVDTIPIKRTKHLLIDSKDAFLVIKLKKGDIGVDFTRKENVYTCNIIEYYSTKYKLDTDHVTTFKISGKGFTKRVEEIINDFWRYFKRIDFKPSKFFEYILSEYRDPDPLSGFQGYEKENLEKQIFKSKQKYYTPSSLENLLFSMISSLSTPEFYFDLIIHHIENLNKEYYKIPMDKQFFSVIHNRIKRDEGIWDAKHLNFVNIIIVKVSNFILYELKETRPPYEILTYWERLRNAFIKKTGIIQ